MLGTLDYVLLVSCKTRISLLAPYRCSIIKSHFIHFFQSHPTKMAFLMMECIISMYDNSVTKYLLQRVTVLWGLTTGVECHHASNWPTSIKPSINITWESMYVHILKWNTSVKTGYDNFSLRYFNGYKIAQIELRLWLDLLKEWKSSNNPSQSQEETF